MPFFWRSSWIYSSISACGTGVAPILRLCENANPTIRHNVNNTKNFFIFVFSLRFFVFLFPWVIHPDFFTNKKRGDHYKSDPLF
jgi:hypothetical protein